MCPPSLRRFGATTREYKYFVVLDGSLDLGAMQEAVKHFIGEHDFRNFCKAHPTPPNA